VSVSASRVSRTADENDANDQTGAPGAVVSRRVDVDVDDRARARAAAVTDARADEHSRTARASRRVDMTDDGRRRTTTRASRTRGACMIDDDSWETHTP
jgi:hypothetical protein